ncbi:Kinesin-associated protein 3 [Phlyctochytrium bullatum]|nr:Kinesin-associated protein 3 [Phlyctochytrium bullatum]
MGDELYRKITPGSIDVHPTENALIVNYYVQATMVDENGYPVSCDRKAMQKIIRVKSLGPSSNLSNLAREIVEKCKLIHPSKEREVEQVLYYLQQRSMSEESSDQSSKAWLKKQMEEVRIQTEDEIYSRAGQVEKNVSSLNGIQDDTSPSLDRIEFYIEGLYEEIPEKVAATRKILQLAKMPENMEALISNGFQRHEASSNGILEALISALSRVLREDNKKSMELVTNIIYIFFCFSNYSRFHPLITANKIGDMCLRVTDQELHRYNIWMQDLEKLESKFCFHLLLNLAEDLNIEVKMVKRDIVKYLLTMLERKTPELLILTVTFLKKLSIFKENKDEMVKALQTLVLRLLLNLSHDAKFRMGLIRFGFLEKVVELLHSKAHILLALQVLYQLSIDFSSRSAFAATEVIPMMIKMILEYKGERVNLELMALAINISTDLKCAEMICEDNGLKFLIRRAIKTKDTLILKMLRNIAAHDSECKLLFLDYIDDLMPFTLKNMANPEVMVEVLGIFGVLTIPDFDYAKLAEAYNLIGFIENQLMIAIRAAEISKGQGSNAGLTENDDIVLEVVVLLGTMAHDENIPPMIGKSNLIHLLMDLMLAKEEDDEIVLQIIFATYQLLLHEDTRNILINKTQVVSYLIDLLYDRNTQIRRMCDVCLDIIAEIDEDWVKNIKQQKFQWHNAEYLAVVAQASDSQGDEEYDHEDDDVAPAGRYKEEWRRQLVEDQDTDDEEIFSSRLIGGTNALLEGP